MNKQAGCSMEFETGSLKEDQIKAVLNTLPVDITFIDSEDTVRFFNKPEKRIFVRPKTVIGRKVQQCHPQKSLHIVEKIVGSFKSGKRNTAEFWIDFKGRFVHIQFYALRDEGGNYLGAMEVVQDLTDLRALQGEKRLLDWKD